jgi:hypothetical protein
MKRRGRSNAFHDLLSFAPKFPSQPSVRRWGRQGSYTAGCSSTGREHGGWEDLSAISKQMSQCYLSPSDSLKASFPPQLLCCDTILLSVRSPVSTVLIPQSWILKYNYFSLTCFSCLSFFQTATLCIYKMYIEWYIKIVKLNKIYICAYTHTHT